MHSNSTVFSLITIKGVPNMKKHLINLSQYWDQNRTQMKLLQQVIMSPVVTLSLIRYNSFSCSNFYFVMPVSRSRKNLGQFICCFPIIHASPCCFLDIIQSESIHFPCFFRQIQAGLSALEDALEAGYEDFKVIKRIIKSIVICLHRNAYKTISTAAAITDSPDRS